MKILIILVILILVGVGIFYLFPQINYREMPKGLMEGRLPPGLPNWVSSLVPTSDPHYIAPLKTDSLPHLAACIHEKLPQVVIKQVDTSKLIAYHPSKVFHFVDWLYIHADGGVSSSATMGHSDFGKNRELVEQIRVLCSAH